MRGNVSSQVANLRGSIPTSPPHPRPLPRRGEGEGAPRTKAPELAYAPKPPLRRRKVVRQTVLLALLAGVVAAGVWWFPVVRGRVVLYLLQRRCLNHAPPADEVVYDVGAERASALMSDGRYHHFAGPPQAAFLVPKYWSDFYSALSPPGFKSHGTVFMGRMKTPDGEARLVAIDMVIDSSSEILLTSRVVQPGTLHKRPVLLSASIYRFASAELTGAAVTPGRTDPADPSHVILFGGRVQGWLRDEEPADFVDLFQIDVTPPAPSSPASLPTSAGPATRPSASPGAR